MNIYIVSLICGFIFSVGLGLAGMTVPAKIIGFLDVFGKWDYSLALVMIGAIGVHLFAYLAMKKRKKPVLADTFSVPTPKPIDAPLIVGALLFGIGWGLAGFCPGPAITSLVTMQPEVITFVISMCAGMYAHKIYENMMKR